MNSPTIAKSRRLRSTIFTSRIEEQGLTKYTVYNKMLLPAQFSESLIDTYYHLKKYCQLWDVSVQRVISITGRDSKKLTQLMTPRDLTNAKIGKCYYCPIVDDDGYMLNDPIIMKLSEEEWWISIADSDLLLFARGLSIGMNLETKIIELDSSTLACQGPKSFDIMAKIFGEEIKKLKFYNFNYYTFNNHKFLIARSGWSKAQGFEIYILNDEAGLKLYDEFFKVGDEFNLKPGCPHLIERIEGGLLSYGNDISPNDTPLECGFDKYLNLESDINFLGKEKLIEMKKNGINKKLMGVKINISEIEVTGSLNLFFENKKIGELRSACFSPKYETVIGIAMINKPYFEVGQSFEINLIDKSNKNIHTGKICELPFI